MLPVGPRIVLARSTPINDHQSSTGFRPLSRIFIPFWHLNNPFARWWSPFWHCSAVSDTRDMCWWHPFCRVWLPISFCWRSAGYQLYDGHSWEPAGILLCTRYRRRICRGGWIKHASKELTFIPNRSSIIGIYEAREMPDPRPPCYSSSGGAGLNRTKYNPWEPGCYKQCLSTVRMRFLPQNKIFDSP